MIQQSMLTYPSPRTFDRLFSKMFVKFFNNVVAVGNEVFGVVTTMVTVHKAVDVEAFLAFHAMHCASLVTVAEATEKAHQLWCFSGVWRFQHLHKMVSVRIVGDDDIVVVVVVVVFDGIGDGRLRDIRSRGLVVGFRVGQRH